ncbi:MAG: hypothetical protein LUD47_01400 [Clostridia bacterium]|nr:hypothetical protein [Clostridia bacterium]
MRVKSGDSFMKMLHDIKKLRRLGYSYLFVDDVTNSSDFLSGADFFARNAEKYGFKMVITGSDSLSIVFAKDNALYEQCFLLSTTFIPFREHERVLGPKGIDEYLTIAGTMNPGPAKTRKSSKEYISVSVAENIQNSLENYRYGGYFNNTGDLHEDGKLIDAICDVADEFTRQFLVRALDASVMSERKDIHAEIFSGMLKILSSTRYRCRVGENVVWDIRLYLKEMGVLYEMNCFEISNHCEEKTVDVTSLQWLGYARAAHLIENLLKRSEFAYLSAEEKDIVRGELLDSIKATLMEDTALLETKLAKPAARVWGLSATAGEPHCMVVKDKENSTVFVYELVHGERGPSNRFGALHMYSETERIFGKITERRVLYLGETTDTRGTPYINVEEYLRSL